jgi:uracil-DNA glycosylase family 4
LPMDAWEDLLPTLKGCCACDAACTPSLRAPGSRPLDGRFRRWPKGALFIFEAPNWNDTFDHDKGYLTYDRDTDQTGRFTRRLLREELQLDVSYFQVTNAVLCLPRRLNGKYPVDPTQLRSCSPLLRRQIEALNPAVVVPVGGKALAATRLIERHGIARMRDAVARKIPWAGRWLFPLYHPSVLGRNPRTGRLESEQRADWRALRSVLLELGAEIPPPSRDQLAGNAQHHL